jgi:hypothetical protein
MTFVLIVKMWLYMIKSGKCILLWKKFTTGNFKPGIGSESGIGSGSAYNECGSETLITGI